MTMTRLSLLFTLVIFEGIANANIVDLITGADMAGMEVTVTFADGSEDSATWVTTSTAASDPETFEGFAGEAMGIGWTLQQQGRTQGGICGGEPGCPQDDLLGLWTMTNDQDGQAITDVTIDAIAGNILFDRFLEVEGTAGSSFGRSFFPEDASVTGSYIGSQFSDPALINPDLFTTLTISWGEGALASGQSLRFFADTDRLVPVPATVLLLLAGMLGLGVRSRLQRTET